MAEPARALKSYGKKSSRIVAPSREHGGKFQAWNRTGTYAEIGIYILQKSLELNALKKNTHRELVREQDIQMAGEVGLSVQGKMGELLIEPIQRELGYFSCFNNNFQELQTQLEKLKATREDVQQAREDAEIVKKEKKLSVVIIELVQSGAQLPHTGRSLPVSPINIGDYIGDARDFNRRSQIVEDIIEKLRDEKTMLIGICGMGGIGKTTLSKQVLQTVQDFPKPLFDVQVISTVSNSPNFNTIQQEVAEMLGSSLKKIENEILRAEQLRKAFSIKKVVVLLDDVWKEFDLNAFGLLLALEVVEGALVNKRTSAWNDMLFRLQSQQLHHDKKDKVVQTSYDFLEDHEAQCLFLLCCLFQEDKYISIQTLYRYAVGLQLFKGMDLHRISDRVDTLLEDLTKRNLLINVKEYAVKMHDVVRDVGISIAKQENNGINYLECDGMDELENIDTPHTKMISILFRKNSLEVFNTMKFRGSKLELL
ncbi:probable disease resistance protein At1g61190 [Impatiens glandulifera]|uniref:probable disease resistance protein At1g61190 n=1 Tax=Impatiens glandulifera TaxID=253017 RepID=UPI001FB186DA|nr:probable disease resistance protein At1g61190 [Impatiens glandulifera]